MRFPKKVYILRSALRITYRKTHLICQRLKNIFSLEYFLFEFPHKIHIFAVFPLNLFNFLPTVRFTFPSASNATPTFYCWPIPKGRCCFRIHSRIILPCEKYR